MIVYQDRIEVAESMNLEDSRNSGKQPNNKVVLQYEKRVIDMAGYEDFLKPVRGKNKEQPKREKWFCFAYFLQFNGSIYLVVVDCELDLLFFELSSLVNSGAEPICRKHLVKDAILFDLS